MANVTTKFYEAIQQWVYGGESRSAVIIVINEFNYKGESVVLNDTKNDNHGMVETIEELENFGKEEDDSKR